MAPRTLSDLVFHVRELSVGRGDFLSVRLPTGRESLSASDFVSNVHGLALALEEQGVEPGDRVAIFSENRPEWPTVDFACQLLGVPTVPIYPSMGAEQVGYILRNSGSRMIFYSDTAKRDLLDGLEGALTRRFEAVAFDADAVLDGGPSLTRLLGRGAARRGEVPLERLRGRVDEDDLASVIYTSGTTGDPKGVMLTQANLVSNFLALSKIWKIGDGDLAMSLLPLPHVFQRTIDHLCLYRGAAIHYVPRFDDVMPALRELRPTIVASVPRLWERARARTLAALESESPPRRLLDRWCLEVGRRYAAELQEGFVGPLLALERWIAERLLYRRLRGRFGGRLRLAISVGALLAPEVSRFYEAIGMPVYQGYGLTETSPVLAMSAPKNRRSGSVGRAVPTVEVRIAEDGEIHVKSPGVMRGYWERPEATRESLDDDGWLATGDIGAIDTSGYLFITDRKRDLLSLAGGRTLAPQPIESRLTSHAAISQAVVVGDGREAPAVLVVPDALTFRAELGEEDLSPEEIALHPAVRRRIATLLAEVNADLPEGERLRRFRVLPRELTVEAGELTPTYQIRRRAIRRRYAEEIAALYAKEGTKEGTKEGEKRAAGKDDPGDDTTGNGYA